MSLLVVASASLAMGVAKGVFSVVWMACSLALSNDWSLAELHAEVITAVVEAGPGSIRYGHNMVGAVNLQGIHGSWIVLGEARRMCVEELEGGRKGETRDERRESLAACWLCWRAGVLEAETASLVVVVDALLCSGRRDISSQQF